MAAPDLDALDADQMNATKLFECHDCNWFEVVDGQRQLLLSGKMEAAMVLHDGSALLLLNIGSSWVSDQAIKFVLTETTPSMRAGAVGIYMFPSEAGYFGLQFGRTVAEPKLASFEQLLRQFSTFTDAQQLVNAEGVEDVEDLTMDANYRIVNATSKSVSYVQKGTQLMTDSIHTLSSATSKAIKWGAEYAKKHIKSNEEELEVSDNVKWQAQKIKQAGGAAVTLSKSLVTGAIATASQLTHTMYESASSSGTGHRIERVMQDPKAQSAAKVAVVTADAAWQVYMAMAQASLQFCEDIADATADVVEHKYGEQAGGVARDGMSAMTSGVEALTVVNNAVYQTVADGVIHKQLEAVVDNPDATVVHDEEPAPAVASPAQAAAIMGGLD